MTDREPTREPESAAIEAVRALHKPMPQYDRAARVDDVCGACSGGLRFIGYPCPTIQALDAHRASTELATCGHGNDATCTIPVWSDYHQAYFPCPGPAELAKTQYTWVCDWCEYSGGGYDDSSSAAAALRAHKLDCPRLKDQVALSDKFCQHGKTGPHHVVIEALSGNGYSSYGCLGPSAELAKTPTCGICHGEEGSHFRPDCSGASWKRPGPPSEPGTCANTCVSYPQSGEEDVAVECRHLKDCAQVPPPDDEPTATDGDACVRDCTTWRGRIREAWSKLGSYVSASENSAYTSGWFDGLKYARALLPRSVQAQLTDEQIEILSNLIDEAIGGCDRDEGHGCGHCSELAEIDAVLALLARAARGQDGEQQP